MPGGDTGRVRGQNFLPRTLDIGLELRVGVQTRDMSPEQFTAFVAAQVKDWYQPVKDSGAKLN